MGREAEPVAHRPGQQARPGGRADQGERGDVERDRGRAGALAEHYVDAEVLHRGVEELLGRAGDPVDLVDEEHLAGRERREDGDQVTGPLDRGAAGEPQRHRQLLRDDHGKARLAEARRPGQQHVVRRAPPAARTGQHDRQLFPCLALPDELRQRPRPQSRLERTLLGVRRGRGRDEPFLASHVPHCPVRPLPPNAAAGRRARRAAARRRRRPGRRRSPPPRPAPRGSSIQGRRARPSPARSRSSGRA